MQQLRPVRGLPRGDNSERGWGDHDPLQGCTGQYAPLEVKPKGKDFPGSAGSDFTVLRQLGGKHRPKTVRQEGATRSRPLTASPNRRPNHLRPLHHRPASDPIQPQHLNLSSSHTDHLPALGCPSAMLPDPDSWQLAADSLMMIQEIRKDFCW